MGYKRIAMEIERVLLNPHKPLERNGHDPQEHDIDGFIEVSNSGQMYQFPFRRERNGGKNTSGQPYVWEWENPDEPLDDITLSPNIKVNSSEFKIYDGELQEVKK